MNSNSDEKWYPINGYEGLYQVSDQGRVRSLKFGKERILKQGRHTCGYLYVILCKNNKRSYQVHRLVAQAFLPNPNNLPEVNHKDENKENNSVQNLEWCDHKYNINYGTLIQRISKPVLQYSKSGEFIKEWKSLSDVVRNLGYPIQNISSCCLGKRKSASGFIWRYS